ncbi:YSC84-related protein [Ruegeria lacuscaerulensis]|nr:YSC84-related protein [Ruegeria lacuscaerulensis]
MNREDKMLRFIFFAAFLFVGILGFPTEQSAYAENLLDKVTKGVSDAAKKAGDVAETASEAVLDTTSGLTASEIDNGASAALDQLYSNSSEARDLSEEAIAILIFPKVTAGGLVVGGQFGEGAMRENGVTTGYYNIAGASYGFQAGVQQFSYAMFFMNDAALEYFRNNNGWEAGTGPTLVGGDQGWSASMGTNDLQGDIVPIVFGQEGLMAGTSLKGTKISKIDK